METKIRVRGRATGRSAGTEVLLWAATAGQLVFGVLTGILVLGLIPGDKVGFNVIGSLVLCVITGAAALGCWAFRRAHNDL
jgi:hypothetical protein